MIPPFSIIVSRQPQSCPVKLKLSIQQSEDPDQVFSSLQWMGLQFPGLIFQISCPLPYSFVDCLLQFTRGTVFELVLPPMLRIRGYPMLKSVFLGVGNLTHVLCIMECLVSTLLKAVL